MEGSQGVAARVDGEEVGWEDVDLDGLAAMTQAGVRSPLPGSQTPAPSPSPAQNP